MPPTGWEPCQVWWERSGSRTRRCGAMIQAAARRLETPVTLVALTVDDRDLAGIFIGDPQEAWNAAADCSAERHILTWCESPYQRVLSCAPPMYDELWTAAKAMYKLEPVMAAGGEVVIYAPHLEVVSRAHGKFINEIGYHILPYFLDDWQRFKHYPLGVLAHSTHLRGSGEMVNGRRSPACARHPGKPVICRGLRPPEPGLSRPGFD